MAIRPMSREKYLLIERQLRKQWLKDVKKYKRNSKTI